MRKIDLSDYQTEEGQNFQVRPSLVSVLFSEGKLDPREIIRRDELAVLIENYVGDSFLVEESNYNKLVSGLEASDLKPLGRAAVPFIKRILDAPIVSVTEENR